MSNELVDRVPDVFDKDDDSNISKILKLAADKFNEDRETIAKIKRWRDIDQAEGTTLDLIGKDVGQLRSGMNDDEFRQRIKIKIRSNLSEGDIETLNDICIVLIGDRFQGIDEGWTLPEDHPIGPKPAMMLFTVKADNVHYGFPIAEIDDVAGGGIGTNWQLLIDSNINISAQYKKNEQDYFKCGEVLTSANSLNTGVLL